MKSLQTEDVVVLDEDDDEVVEVKEKNKYSKFTSTPANKAELGSYRKSGYENSDKDVILVKTTKSPKDKQLDSKLFSFNHLKTPGGSDKPLFTIGK